MNKLLLSLIIKDNSKENIATVTSIVGIICNIILFIVKVILGILTNSIALISDSLNNLSDCGSCIVSIWGYKMASKPADKDHPFGHGRAEYVSTFVVAILILYVGLQCFISAIDKIFHPGIINANLSTVFILLITIGIKLWMGSFYKYSSNITNNSTLKASSIDSYNDCLLTLASLVAIVATLLFNINIDGLIATLVSIMIIKGGYSLIKETINQLIGQTPDATLSKQLIQFLNSDDMVLGTHDVLMHYYGQQIYASAHVEIDSRLNILDVHDHIDLLEQNAFNNFKIHLTIHMDPIVVGNETIDFYHNLVNQYLDSLHNNTTCHDFRVVLGNTHDNCVFDVALPYDYDVNTNDLTKNIENYLNNNKIDDRDIYCIINYDRF